MNALEFVLKPLTRLRSLEPIREVLESDESDVIPCRALDSLLRSARCGHPNTGLRLERLLAQLWYPQPYLASLGLQAALVVASAGIATRLAALIPLRIAQPICLGIEQGVQRFLHGPPDHPLQVALDPLIVNVMTLFSGLGVSSDMAAPSCWPGCV